MNPTKMLPSERHGIPLNSISSAILDAERQTPTAHTPGPWTYKEGMVYSETDPHGRNIATIREHDQTANGKLIAAAPALLEALRWLCVAVETGIGDWRNTDAARAAIAKAEGGAQ